MGTCSKEWAVFLLSRMRTALRGRLPLRMTVMRRGFIGSAHCDADVDVDIDDDDGAPGRGLQSPLLVDDATWSNG